MDRIDVSQDRDKWRRALEPSGFMKCWEILE
jgi:hypothetical protein